MAIKSEVMEDNLVMGLLSPEKGKMIKKKKSRRFFRKYQIFRPGPDLVTGCKCFKFFLVRAPDSGPCRLFQTRDLRTRIGPWFRVLFLALVRSVVTKFSLVLNRLVLVRGSLSHTSYLGQAHWSSPFVFQRRCFQEISAAETCFLNFFLSGVLS